jgi:hypothetical protein
MKRNYNMSETPDALEQLMIDTATRLQTERDAKIAADKLTAKSTGITMEQLGELFAQFGTQIDAKIQKAIEPIVKEEDPDGGDQSVQHKGIGRKGTVAAIPTAGASARETNPLQYLVTKARTAADAGEVVKYDATDKALVWALTKKGLTMGMSQEDTEDEIDLDNL